MISEKDNMSSQGRRGEPSDIELDSETWSDQETLVGEDNPGEGGSSGGKDLCLRSKVGTDLVMGDNTETQTELQSKRTASSTRNANIEVLHSEPLIANNKLPADIWILNCTWSSSDRLDREKFIFTYIPLPNQPHRVTISCDYENAEPDSLEARLKQIQYQCEKGEEIYDSLRTSLPDIRFFDTVTNLRLNTSDGRLHVHVTEDVNQIIPYPLRTTLDHILNSSPTSPIEIRESQLEFGHHMSGFVYKVRYARKDYIKKEIPGPDAVDEFLYEVNALNDLNASGYVIRLEAVVVDDSGRLVKGLLINFAQQGTLADLLFKHQGTIPWEDRIRWGQQAVRGLGHVHEAGYVQGDLTLSNLVVDLNGDAKIIDFNRRGCPVGWEPPEIEKIIASEQRVSMYIGEKTDIYQLGMTLWALAMEDDSPEWQKKPLSVDKFPKEVPGWYRDLVRSCLALQPPDRPSATDLVRRLPLSLSPARQTMILEQEPLACLSDHSTETKTDEETLVALPDDFAKDTSGNTTSLMPDCSKTPSLADLERQISSLEEFVQIGKSKLDSLDKAKFEVRNDLQRLEERIKGHKKRVSGIVGADGRSKGENNETGEEVQEEQCMHAEVEEEVIQ